MQGRVQAATAVGKSRADWPDWMDLVRALDDTALVSIYLGCDFLLRLNPGRSSSIRTDR
jgi:hypothetical protein